MSKIHTLGKTERLKSRKLIDSLFQKGKSMNVFPFRVYYMFTDLNADTPVQAGVSASKKYFKRAVDRNRIKRLTREAYRLQKIPLKEVLQAKNLQLAVFFIYTGKTIPTYIEVFEKMGIIVNKLSEQIVQRS
ncbi:ribonuclease P protein component [Pinibacter aurantiacus]|uniref:Ribonuclease P protein component n=1 Tax=Pinibacter aurantiacus TaxID=2851599 RepID=A0A9E2SD44_9BACT|nr:ribonuclease P protein component [Pinibacter aurantiacus]MBV4359167.1 ribonuclease P protein component [Pinibacter aurantiacus]